MAVFVTGYADAGLIGAADICTGVLFEPSRVYGRYPAPFVFSRTYFELAVHLCQFDYDYTRRDAVGLVARSFIRSLDESDDHFG